ncbi:ribosomal protein S11 [Medicago truncatula]|uniref:Ribosomal protein S11 n=1 Tax=Medicago truncatula TaxID=3880 RepID=A0A072UVT7_MEDTR|nr:ribosomal protein S11 [Medicago truncatula]
MAVIYVQASFNNTIVTVTDVRGRVTCNYGMIYTKNHNNQNYEVFGYSGYDWSGDKDDRKCTVAYVFKYAQWISMLMLEMNMKEDKKMELLIDNKYVIEMAKHIVAHGRTNTLRHIFIFLGIKSTMKKPEANFLKIIGDACFD